MYTLKRSFYIYELNLHPSLLLNRSVPLGPKVVQTSRGSARVRTPRVHRPVRALLQKAILKSPRNCLLTSFMLLCDVWKSPPGECALRKSKLLKSSNLCSALPLRHHGRRQSGPKRSSQVHPGHENIYILIIYIKCLYLIRYVHFSQDVWGAMSSEMKRRFIR